MDGMCSFDNGRVVLCKEPGSANRLAGACNGSKSRLRNYDSCRRGIKGRRQRGRGTTFAGASAVVDEWGRRQPGHTPWGRDDRMVIPQRPAPAGNRRINCKAGAAGRTALCAHATRRRCPHSHTKSGEARGAASLLHLYIRGRRLRVPGPGRSTSGRRCRWRPLRWPHRCSDRWCIRRRRCRSAAAPHRPWCCRTAGTGRRRW